MDIAQRLFSLILARRYQMTDHVLESMGEDNLTLNDVLSWLGTGRARRTWARQREHEIEGRSVDGRPMRVVGRLIGTRLLRISTVHEAE